MRFLLISGPLFRIATEELRPRLVLILGPYQTLEQRPRILRYSPLESREGILYVHQLPIDRAVDRTARGRDGLLQHSVDLICGDGH